MGHDLFELGLGLGTCKWRVAIGTMQTLTLTRVSSQPGAGETEHRQRGLFERPGGPETKTADRVPFFVFKAPVVDSEGEVIRRCEYRAHIEVGRGFRL